MKENQSVFQIDDAGRRFLKERWAALTSHYTDDENESDRLLSLLADLYGQKTRAYHNLSHIHSLLSLSESFKEKIRDRDALSFAVWFHDAVYNTRRNDNEEKSAELARRSMRKLRVPDERVEAVCKMILATKSHDPMNLSDDARLFLDLDLSILGAAEGVYEAYSRAIRKEYSWVPYFLYRRSRKKILADFSRREAIYLTREMRARFDLQARLNIKSEIAALSK